MTEPYKKVGRGGAGNFYSKKGIEDVSKAAASDLEAQNPDSTNPLTQTLSASKPPPEYLHTGRGGAGNWFQPSELQSQGLSQNNASDANPTSTQSTKKIIGQSKPTYRGGRGGAGNYVDFGEEERLKKEREELEEGKRKEMEANVERDVEAGLARPPRAYGGVGGAWEMSSMTR